MSHAGGPSPGASPDRQRLDKWLFFARVARSRSLAARMVGAGLVRINGDKIGQPSRPIRVGDVVTIAAPRRVLVYRVVDCGTRRGPAPEARTLYDDLSPPPAERPTSRLDDIVARRDPGAGRPTKKERRALDSIRPDKETG